MQTYEALSTQIAQANTVLDSLKLTNELLLDIREALRQSTARTEGVDLYEANKLHYVAAAKGISLMDLPIATRTKTGLTYANIRTFEDLEGWSAYDLAKLRHLGAKSIRELAAIMKEHGLHLPGADTLKPK